MLQLLHVRFYTFASILMEIVRTKANSWIEDDFKETVK